MIKLHFNYLLTKVNILIFSIMLFIVLISNIIGINLFDSNVEEFINRENIIVNYKNMYFLICKLLNILFSCYLFGYSFYYNNDNYCVLIDSFRKNRFPYLISKVITLSMIVVFYNVVLYLFYLFIGVVGNKYFVFQIDVFSFFIKILFISLIYGFVSGVLTMFLKSYFVILVPYILFIVSEVLNESGSGFIVFYQIFLPTVNDVIGLELLIGVLVFYFFVMLIKYNQHEI